MKTVSPRPTLLQMYESWITSKFSRTQYPFQVRIAAAILKTVIYERKHGSAAEIAVEISRQSGKTTLVVDVVSFLMAFFPPISIGIFAPQREQAKTDFDRLKHQLNITGRTFGWFNPDEKNANTLRLSNGSEAYIFPVTPTSHPESKTLDLIIAEEAQNMNDHEFKNDVRPMGAARNAPIIFIGTAGYHICYFSRLLDRDNRFVFTADEIIKQKRQVYEQTNDSFHLNYERFVESERRRLGEESDEFQAPYMLKWILGAGQFMTHDQIGKLLGNYSRTREDKKNKCYAGIDTAKNPDSTVVTVVRWNEELKKKQLLNWMELRGDNYEDQFDAIVAFLSHYNVVALAIDSTGQGDFMPDKFERKTKWRDERSGLFRVKFTLPTKDILYKNLSVVVQNSLTELPNIETKEAERFKQQMLELQKEYRGELLTCHHPDEAEAHDDYCDSWALAELAYTEMNKRGQPNIRVLSPTIV